MKALVNGKIIKDRNILEDHVIVFDKTIKAVIPKSQWSIQDNMEVIDVGGMFISPGFIDIHIHGAGGSDTMDGTMEDLKVISKTISSRGVTAFLPTTMTMAQDKVYQALETIGEAMGKRMPGAQVLGAHMEGPFISEKYKGAQNAKYIIKPRFDWVKDYLDVIKIITLAPEEDDHLDFIGRMKKEDVVLSMGHTQGSYKELMAAVREGVSHVTHLFNAMTPLHHREPGAVGVALSTHVTCELIADTIHVHPGLLQFVIDTKGLERVVLITDSMRAGCLQEGMYNLGGQKVVVDSQSARLEDGTLAGSILTMDQALKNIMEHTSLSLGETVELLSLNPAKVLRMDREKGSIGKEKDADFCILDGQYNVRMTISQGERVYDNR